MPDPLRATVDEVKLLDRLRRGDRAALADLYDAYVGRALLVARHILLADAAAAEDAIAGAFLVVWRRRERADAGVGAVLLRHVHEEALRIRADAARRENKASNEATTVLPTSAANAQAPAEAPRPG